MRVLRTVKFPGAQQYESSGFEVELTDKELHLPDDMPLQQKLHRLFQETQLTIMYHAMLDCMITPDEFKRRMCLWQKEFDLRLEGMIKDK